MSQSSRRRSLLVATVAVAWAGAPLLAQPAAKPRRRRQAGRHESPRPTAPPPSPPTRSRASSSGTSGPRSWAAASTTSRSSEGNPSIFYVGTASGGILKTVEQRRRPSTPVFDDQAVSSIGDLAIAPSDPVDPLRRDGRAEQPAVARPGATASTRRRTAGKTWQHLGLADTHHIGRIVVHPRNPDVVVRGRPRPPLGPEQERGLYKTTDGGKTWANTKFIDEDTGFVDVAMDPESPEHALRRLVPASPHLFGYNGGGPGSGLWKTTDGGATWTKLTKGLPTDGDMGRIGVSVYRKDPRDRLRGGRAREGGRRSTAPRTRARPGRRCRRQQPAALLLQPDPSSTRTTTGGSGSWARPCTTRRTAARRSDGTGCERSTATTTRCGSTPRAPTTCWWAPTAASTRAGIAGAPGTS